MNDKSLIEKEYTDRLTFNSFQVILPYNFENQCMIIFIFIFLIFMKLTWTAFTDTIADDIVGWSVGAIVETEPMKIVNTVH